MPSWRRLFWHSSRPCASRTLRTAGTTSPPATSRISTTIRAFTAPLMPPSRASWPARSALAQQEADHPAAPYMVARGATVVNDVLVRAARVLQGVGQERQPVRLQRAGGQAAVLVG